MPRWHTFEAGIPEEARIRNQQINQIERWWMAFSERSVAIDRLFKRKEEWDIAEWMQDNLRVVDEELFWEYGPGIPSGHRLVITPESNRWLRPMVEHLLSVAPVLPGWQFHGWRLAESLDDTRMTIEGRTGSPWSATGGRLTKGNGNRIDVVFTYPADRHAEDTDLVWKQAFVATETLFGEHAMDYWTGVIETAEAGPEDIPLERMPKAFEDLRGDILRSLPADLCLDRAETSSWTGWKLKPDKSDDYENQHDLFYGKSMYPELWTMAHSNGVFSSARFSPRETFCYLKLDGKEGIEDEGFKDKAEIEDAIDAALRPLQLGCHIGGGTGLRYSYVDLALTDWRKALPVIREVLRAGRVPKRSWLLFYDSDWMHEWCGIHPDSPVPPGIS
jgi:hypothetical protein